MTALRLRKNEDRRLRAGHLWVFSNEIDTATTPLKGLEPGQDVVLERADGRFVAHAYANPQSLIAARITSTDPDRPFDEGVLASRLTDALALRTRRFDAPFYRWVHGEGDALPGLVVDRYGETAVVQITTAGMARREASLVELLVKLGPLSHVILDNTVAVRALEGLPLERRIAFGGPVERLHVHENGLDFEIPVGAAQKTGWFYDHRESRRAIRAWAGGARVLDLYGYVGAFALNAAAAGAREVLSVDRSADAIATLADNARRQGVEDRVQGIVDDVPERLRRLAVDGERFDLVVLDPPAFAKRRKDLDAGRRHYGQNNRLAMQLLTPGGILATASCSQAIDGADFDRIVRQSVPRGRAPLRVVDRLRQGADHPVNLAMAETSYLKGLIAQVG